MVYRRSVRPRRPRRSGRPTARPRRKATRTPRRTRRQSQPCKCPAELTPAARFALAQLDPFDPRASGAKIPDSNTMPSIANTDVDQVALTVPGARTVAAIAFTPTYRGGTMVAAVASGDVITWPRGFAAGPPPVGTIGRRNADNVIAQLEAIRPVAHAIRMSSSLSATAAKGFVHIGLSVESRFSDDGLNLNYQWPTTINDMTGLAHYKRVTLSSLTQSPLTVINKWLDETAFRYDDTRAYQIDTTAAGTPATTSVVQSTFNLFGSWATIVVMLEGVTAGETPISFEHILLTEALPKKNSFIIGTPAAPNSPSIVSAVSSMQSETDFAHTEAGQSEYVAQGLQALQDGAERAGDTLMSTVVIPTLQRGAYAGAMTGATMLYNAVVGRGGISGVNSNPSRLAIG